MVSHDNNLEDVADKHHKSTTDVILNAYEAVVHPIAHRARLERENGISIEHHLHKETKAAKEARKTIAIHLPVLE